MLTDADLRKLAEMSVQERAFLSIYLEDPRSVEKLGPKLKKMRKTLSSEEGEKSEREYLDQDIELVNSYFKENPLKHGGLCLFVCGVLDYFQAIQLTAPVKDHVCFDSSPYIRPLAEMKDEYENAAVVVADNKRARIFLVTAAQEQHEEQIAGNVKNHVRKGGWSQQRYERRRDKQLLLYAREIVKAVSLLDNEEDFRRIILVGGKEILGIVYDNLPKSLQKKVAGRKASDLGQGEKSLNRDIWELFFEEERRSEMRLWDIIRNQMFRGGLGVVGLQAVLEAAKTGRVEKIVVDREFKPSGMRCRKCDNLHGKPVTRCASCGSESLYPVEVVNEICELVVKSGGETEFMDACPTLVDSGSIGALLRY